MRHLLLAIQFLTILPVPSPRRCDPEDLGRATAWFPLVGLLLGGLLWLADLGLTPLFPRHLTDALLVTLLAVLTGGLHLDGLADVCDGLAARGDKQRFLAAMKDSHVGALGAVGLMLGKLFDRPDLSVFNLASVVSGGGELDFDLAMRVNLDGNLHVLESARALGSKPRVVFASSIAVPPHEWRV